MAATVENIAAKIDELLADVRPTSTREAEIIRLLAEAYALIRGTKTG